MYSMGDVSWKSWLACRMMSYGGMRHSEEEGRKTRETSEEATLIKDIDNGSSKGCQLPFWAGKHIFDTLMSWPYAANTWSYTFRSKNKQTSKQQQKNNRPIETCHFLRTSLSRKVPESTAERSDFGETTLGEEQSKLPSGKPTNPVLGKGHHLQHCLGWEIWYKYVIAIVVFHCIHSQSRV